MHSQRHSVIPTQLRMLRMPMMGRCKIGQEIIMFKWLSTKNATAFGSELAKMVTELAPNDPKLSDNKRQSKVNYAKEKILKRIRQFKQEEILNFYKTAKLLNTFKWNLKDAGYDQKVADAWAVWILISLREK